VKKVLQVTLGILTAIGGFVDIGDLVANAEAGARFRMNLAWVVLVGVIGIVVYAEMAGRVAAVSQRPVFELVRERLGPQAGLVNLVASFFINFLTLTAEIAGVAIAISLVASVHYGLLLPLCGVLVWLVIWRMPFEWMERVFGLAGLALAVFVVTVWKVGPDWGSLFDAAASPHVPAGESPFSYAYFGIALFGAAMTPYEVFFFSSGGVEEHWDEHSLATMRSNVFVGFPLGGLLSLAIAGCAAVTLLPVGISVDSLGQVGLPVALALGKIGLAVVVLGFFAATFGAACETGLSLGYSISQYFGWQWGKYVRPREAARFHVVVLLSAVLAIGVLLTTIDPILVTEFSVVFSAVALPLTYFPILVVANDRDYMGDHANGRLSNFLGSVFLVVVLVAAFAALPLMIWTKMGQ
jgi:Mn2+/Fe2+ NRAMP family transporter